jgi:signal-transduction protein with cAMP-binding, CBS, and nucleotidyltransferase domain
MRKRFQHQAMLLSKNMPPNNDIDPEECSEFDLVLLKKGVMQIEVLKGMINLDSKGINIR